jgi:hypothetical protein
MVQYPNVLNIQTMPQPLKDIAYDRLEAVKNKIHNYKMIEERPILMGITLGQIEGVQNFLRAKDQSELWQDCIEFNRRLDLTRNQSFTDSTPEFKPYV